MMLPYACDQLRMILPMLLCCEVCHAQGVGVKVRDRRVQVCCGVHRGLPSAGHFEKEMLT